VVVRACVGASFEAALDSLWCGFGVHASPLQFLEDAGDADAVLGDEADEFDPFGGGEGDEDLVAGAVAVGADEFDGCVVVFGVGGGDELGAAFVGPVRVPELDGVGWAGWLVAHGVSSGSSRGTTKASLWTKIAGALQ
jgi:hypothetical protein